MSLKKPVDYIYLVLYFKRKIFVMSSSEESPDELENYDINFSPKFFLRCHSKQRKDAADVQTQVIILFASFFL